MPLAFDLESPAACTGNYEVYAIPYIKKGRGTTGSVDQMFLGYQPPDMKDLPGLLKVVRNEMVARHKSLPSHTEVLAVDILQMCNRQNHAPESRSTRKGPSRSERIGALALTYPQAQPIAVREVRDTGGAMKLLREPPIEGTGPVQPTVWMEATAEEKDQNPVTYVIQSAPRSETVSGLHKVYLGGEAAFVALRGHELLIDPINLAVIPNPAGKRPLE